MSEKRRDKIKEEEFQIRNWAGKMLSLGLPLFLVSGVS